MEQRAEKNAQVSEVPFIESEDSILDMGNEWTQLVLRHEVV